MTKAKTIYECQKCGYQSPRWLGRCPECGRWNTLAEEVANIDGSELGRNGSVDAVISEICSLDPKGQIDPGQIRAKSINACLEEVRGRLTSGNKEFDRLLGGGFVPGSVLLLGGDPGVGKSTLLLQIGNHIAKSGRRVLYCSGEESEHQIRMRGHRLGASSDNLFLLAENSLEKILEVLKQVRPGLVVIDSIQTAFTEDLASAPGSVSQVREVAGRLLKIAKRTEVPIVLIGHLTKEGSIAGPKQLEHLVDTVLYFEGDRGQSYRILRTFKNRFGATNEIGVFEMKEEGLLPVENPSEFFLSERKSGISGSVVITAVEGTRPILVELQALVSPTKLGVPRRTAMGIDTGRLSLMLAILEKREGLHFYDQDVFLNVVGGVEIDEPAADLGIIAAIYSSFGNRAAPPDAAFMGEVGLGGEIRAVGQIEARIAEAARLGFKRCFLPATNLKRYTKKEPLELIALESLKDLLGIF